jgi:hypothetical protein
VVEVSPLGQAKATQLRYLGIPLLTRPGKRIPEVLSRPPMPWFNLNAMTEEDLRAMYQYINSLEPKGEPAPAYLPPDQEPPPPYIQFASGP